MSNQLLGSGALALVLALLASPEGSGEATGHAASDEGPPWAEIVGPSEGELPSPAGEVIWRVDLQTALEEARETGRPLFVTLRCLPCHQCSAFDKDVLEGGPRLEPLLAQFITVRLTDARHLDLNLLPMEGFQDMDLSWWGWLLSPEARVYGVFGGKDHVSDTTRISVAALEATLGRVLAHHYDPRRPAWNVDGPAPDQTKPSRKPAGLAGYPSWRASGKEEESCLHCHQVVEIMRQPAIDAGTFDKQRDVAVWPLPENVGLVLDRDHGLLVKSVAENSEAASAGLKAGDVLVVAAGRRLFGQADFRGVLHRAPFGAARIEVHWLRGQELMSGVLELDTGWRQTSIAWRTSISQGNIGAHPGIAWGHRAKPKEREKFGLESKTMAIRPWFGRRNGGPAWRAGLRPSDLIVAIDGLSPDVGGREFMVWFRLRYAVGDEVSLRARSPGGEEREIRYRLPPEGHE